MTKEKHAYKKELIVSEREMHSSKTWDEWENIVTWKLIQTGKKEQVTSKMVT